MKYKYRDHRGSLVESIKTQRVFNNKEEMFKYIVSNWSGFISTEDLSINERDEGQDDRIGWSNTHYVCTKRMGNENYIEKYGCPQCIGMCEILEE